MGKNEILRRVEYGVLICAAIGTIVAAMIFVNNRSAGKTRVFTNPVAVSVLPEQPRPNIQPATVAHDAQVTDIENSIKTLTGSHSPMSAEKLAEGDRDQNIIALDKKISMYPKNAELRLHRASAYMLKGNIEMAVKDMEIASALQPAYMPLTQKVLAAQRQLAEIGRKRLTPEEMAIAKKNMPPEQMAKTMKILMEGHQQPR